jgi:N-acetylmuramoyl-L-alanine amidase
VRRRVQQYRSEFLLRARRVANGVGISGLVLAGCVLPTIAIPAYLARAPSDIVFAIVRQPRLVSARKSTRSLAGTAIDPSLFVKGSCVAFPPTSGDRHKTVFLDAGHGGIDPGGIGEAESGETIYESDINLPIELDTAACSERTAIG